MSVHLSQYQAQLQTIYDVVIPYDVAEFVTTDAAWTQAIDTSVNPREIPEKLLFRQDDDTLDIALYLDKQMIDNLRINDPITCLTESNLVPFCTALEGVSHFLYLLWNVYYGRAISLFELELQAEIDKFVCAAALISSQAPMCPLDILHARLFDTAQFDPALTEAELRRYRSANSLAALYCKRLLYMISSHSNTREMTHDLRRFYRLTSQRKVEHILRPG